AANEYWISVFLAKGNRRKIDDAFLLLKSSLSEQQANEILEKYRPENMDGEVPDEIEREYVQVQRLELPTDMGSGTEISWSAAPKAIALPDRFVAVAFNGDQKRSILFDYEVRRDLSVGPDPLLDQDDEINVNTETGDLLVNED